MRLDELLPKETEDGEGTTTTKEELVFGESLDVDAVPLAFPITEDDWLTPVVEGAEVEVPLSKTADDIIKSWEDVEGNVLLSANVEDMIRPAERLCTLDDTLVTE